MRYLRDYLFSLFLMLSAIMLFSIDAGAETYGPMTYSVFDGEVTITDCDLSVSGALEIPAEIEGYPVTTIGYSAFYGCSRLNSIAIPKSVVSIEDVAFFCCNGLKKVYIDDLTAWCDIEFGDMNSNPLCYADYLYLDNDLIEELIIPDGVERIPSYGFSCNNITSVFIPKSVNKIESCAFRECLGLKSVSISNGVTAIGWSAFEECMSLTSIIIPESVKCIERWAFSDCSALNTLVFQGAVSDMDDHAFWGSYNIEKLALGNGTLYVEDYQFSGLRNLRQLYIPKSMEIIERGSFELSTNLSQVYYGGSADDRKQLIIETDNGPLLNLNWHYNTAGLQEHTYSYSCDSRCDACDEFRSVVHTYGEYKYNDDATCFLPGTKTRVCSVCFETKTVTAEGTRLKDTSWLFKDVAYGQWYKHYIDYVVTHKLLNGTGNGMEPTRTMTRAEFVQVLANLSGINTSNKQVNAGFKDVKAGDWYAPAVKWASANGIVNGMEGNRFAPEDQITREQMCTMLIRYIEGYLETTLEKKANKKTFADDAKISDWAKESVYKCQMGGLVNGVSETMFAPADRADRAAVATIMTRYHLEYINN